MHRYRYCTLAFIRKTNTPKIFGLEIQEEIAQMAQRSVEHNKLEDRISIECGDLKPPFLYTVVTVLTK